MQIILYYILKSELRWVRSESKWRFADALFAVIGCLMHMLNFQVHTPGALELITNSGSNSELTENVYIELCDPADPDLNQVGFINSKLTLQLWVCSSLFVLQATRVQSHTPKQPAVEKETAQLKPFILSIRMFFWRKTLPHHVYLK